MNSSSVFIRSDEDDNTIEIDDSDFTPNFNIKKTYAVPPVGSIGPSLGADMLINRNKISSAALSRASSRSVSEADSDEFNIKKKKTSMSSSASSSASSASSCSDASDSSSSASSSSVESIKEDKSHRKQDAFGSRISAERGRLESEINEKKEILYQMDRLESKGFRLPRKFTMQSELEDMRAEYHRIVREKEVDTSIRFQRKMLMACVTGIEFMNSRFDPFDIKIDGWSEQVHENVNDYDDIFEELHDKYKGTGRKMAPELRLMMSLSGSAFMFHLTSSMFKQQPLPGVEQVLRSNPELMKQFQQAASQQYTGMQMPTPTPQPQPQKQQQSSGGADIFGMMGNLLGGSGLGGLAGLMGGNGGGGGASRQMPQYNPEQQKMSGPSIDSIINNVHKDINTNVENMSNRVETLSISDEEITSIIEDTADMNGILTGSRSSARGRGGGRSGGRKTLNL
jgi:hypothetical protein